MAKQYGTAECAKCYVIKSKAEMTKSEREVKVVEQKFKHGRWLWGSNAFDREFTRTETIWICDDCGITTVVGGCLGRLISLLFSWQVLLVFAIWYFFIKEL